MLYRADITRVNGVKHIEGKLVGDSGVNLYYQGWLPAAKPRAALLVVPGLAEHGGRYVNLVNHFVPRGYAVYALDQRGHGKSDGLRGYVERFSCYLDDLKAFFGVVCGQHRDTRVFIVGHSLGGTIATAYAVHYPDELAGLILSAVSLETGASLSPRLITLSQLLSRLLPKLGMAILDASAISRDQAVVAAYVNDPLVYRGKIRARLGAEAIKAMQRLRHQVSQIKLPILIMHGTADRLSDAKGSETLYGQVASSDKTLKLYAGFYHEIFNEPGREQVFADMETWLAAHL